MIETKLALDSVAASLSVLDHLIKFVEKARAEGKSVSVADVIRRMPIEACTMSADLVHRLERLHKSFLHENIDLKKTIDELQADTGWWRLGKYRLVRDFHATITGELNALGHLMQDYVAVANCREAEGLIAQSFQEAREVQAEIAAIVRRDVPLEDIFQRLLEHAHRVHAALADLIKA